MAFSELGQGIRLDLSSLRAMQCYSFCPSLYFSFDGRYFIFILSFLEPSYFSWTLHFNGYRAKVVLQ
jgi:hypothetical protein